LIGRVKALAKRHWPSLSLGTILFGTLLFVAALPGIGAVFLRVYENTLVQQTEAELIAQGAVLASSYRAAWGAPAEGGRGSPAPEPPSIDLRSDPVFPPPAPPAPAGPPDPRAARVGRALAPIVADASAVTRSFTRLLDAQGVVVAGGRDAGSSYASLFEVRQALAGQKATVLRLRTQSPYGLGSPLELLSRAAAIRVHHARPVRVDGRVVGAVMLSGRPRGLFLGIYQDRGKIALGVLLILLTLVVLAGLLSRGIARPIRALTAASENVANGRLEIPEPPPTAAIEIRELYVNFAVMAERIEARARYLRDFAAAVSHEFKTPLTGIKGVLELLEEHGATMTEEERRHFLANAAGDADRLSRLVQRLLDLARADMTADAGHERSNAAGIARSVAARLRGEKFGIDVEGPPALPLATFSDEALETVLVTLLENSRRAGAGRATIGLERRRNAILIRVRDDGSGIAEADRERVFEPFFTGNRAAGGTGLGLPIARSLLSASGGTIELMPSSRGTTFLITIPAEPGADQLEA
jgi:signal transduction histidine kinase